MLGLSIGLKYVSLKDVGLKDVSLKDVGLKDVSLKDVSLKDVMVPKMYYGMFPCMCCINFKFDINTTAYYVGRNQPSSPYTQSSMNDA